MDAGANALNFLMFFDKRADMTVCLQYKAKLMPTATGLKVNMSLFLKSFL